MRQTAEQQTASLIKEIKEAKSKIEYIGEVAPFSPNMDCNATFFVRLKSSASFAVHCSSVRKANKVRAAIIKFKDGPQSA